MSVDIGGRADGQWLELPELELNVSNFNARDLFTWLGVDGGEHLCGSMDAGELAAKCQRRMWDEARNHDPLLEGFEEDRVIYFGRRAGYLRTRTKELLALAEAVKDLGGTIHWS